jgi:hypothetical protein
MNKTRLIAMMSLMGLGLILPLALVPATITYQARVQNTAHQDLNGPVTVGLRIYGTLSGATVLWGETQAVTAVRGIANVELGRVNSLPGGLFNNPELYLGLSVAGDPEMTPRTRLLSTWKAVSAGRASGRRIQAGGGMLAVSGSSTASVAITFPTPFLSPPVVTVGAPRSAIGGVDFISTRVSDITATGCVVHFSALGGAAATGSSSFDWIAIGD